jgi:hypothetical protein
MMIGLDELSVDPGFWVNRVMAEYYGLVTIKLNKRMVLNKELQKKKKKERHRRQESE